MTFYQGRNDSHLPDKPPTGILSKAYTRMIDHLLLAALIDQAVIGERVSLTDGTVKFEIRSVPIGQVC